MYCVLVVGVWVVFFLGVVWVLLVVIRVIRLRFSVMVSGWKLGM